MQNEFMQRGYLLPEGCKDLIDLLQPKACSPAKPPSDVPANLPPVIGEITIPAYTTVAELSQMIQVTKWQLISDLMAENIFVTLHQLIPFEVASRLARKHGYLAKSTQKNN